MTATTEAWSSRRPVSDGAIVAMAVGAGVGAWWSPAVPLPLALGAVVVALGARRATALVVATVLLVGALGHRAWAGLGARRLSEVDHSFRRPVPILHRGAHSQSRLPLQRAGRGVEKIGIRLLPPQVRDREDRDFVIVDLQLLAYGKPL